MGVGMGGVNRNGEVGKLQFENVGFESLKV